MLSLFVIRILSHDRLSNVEIKLPLCGDEKKEPAHPCCDYNSSAEFYVFVGVIVFLYCIAAIILYVCFDDKYYRRIPGVRTAVSIHHLHVHVFSVNSVYICIFTACLNVSAVRKYETSLEPLAFKIDSELITGEILLFVVGFFSRVYEQF